MRRRDLIAAVAFAVIAAGLVALPAFDSLRGLSLDVLFWLRHRAGLEASEPSRVVVVAIDEETYRRPPFAGTPNATWTREIASVLNAVLRGGADVIGFDLIYPTSMDRFVPGFDREFLLALRDAARAGKIVLSKVQHADMPIEPFAGQLVAVGRGRNVHAVNLVSDADEVVRRAPLFFDAAGEAGAVRRETAFALEVAARAVGAAPEMAPDGAVTLAGRAIPGSRGNAMALNFRGGRGPFATYSLADLAACAANPDTDYFRRHFAGKIVLLGATLDVEDRKLTSMRLMTGADGPSTAERCHHPPLDLHEQGRGRDSIAGVLVHATAIDNLLRGDALRTLPRWADGLLVLALALGAGVATLAWPPLVAIGALAGAAAAWAAGATWALSQALVLPLLPPLAAIALVFAAVLGWRFAVTDRDKRLLRRSFALYLAPAVVDRMLARKTLPELGGEEREVTVFFSDIAGFTAMAEGLAPPALVALMNEYLSAMTEIIEANGGFVDKYIGDAIVAVFGAPLDDPDHALRAVRAALQCRARLVELNATLPALRTRKLAQRIGLNTGPALVGNIGSRRRFNYTAMGDTVNLAARLEGANKVFGTEILVAEETARRAEGAVVLREIDVVRVKGREAPVRVFEPLAEAERETHDQRQRAESYAEGLRCWRAGAFAAAAAAFARAALADPPAAAFQARAAALAAQPPGPGWEPVTALDSK